MAKNDEHGQEITAGRGPGAPEVIMRLENEAGRREVHLHQGGNVLVAATNRHLSPSGFTGGHLGESHVSLQASPELYEAGVAAVDRAWADGNLSALEKQQFNNLRAYITNHSGDGVLDAREQNIAIQRANNIAPENGR